LAALLGFIPGVGAIYNGQVVKGLIHVGVFAGLIWGQTLDVPDGMHVLLGLGIAFWVFYQVFDAYKTAKARMYGLPIPDPFGIERAFGSGAHPVEPVGGAPVAPPPISAYGAMPVYIPPPPEPRQASPVGAVVLIGLGVLFLLNTMGLWHFHWIGRMWPLILIALGLWMFVRRFGTNAPAAQTTTTTNPPEQQ
jgi:TM2 domain-containing membrane protein YozV